MGYAAHERYQFQPWYIKVYRRVRYMPKWILIGVWHEYKGYEHGWDIAMSCGQIDMGYWYTLRETMDSLSSPADSGSDGPNV